jgi:phospholipase/carboxylesterase
VTRSAPALLIVVALAALGACADGDKTPVTASREQPPPTWIARVAQARRVEPDRPPPLLVLLHGIGADENDLFSLATRLDPRFTVVSLRAPHGYHGGYAWFPIDFRPDGTVVPDVAQARETTADLVRWVAAAPARYHTDPRRTFLFGFSQGSMMSLGALYAAPERLAGVVALSGRAVDGISTTAAADGAIVAVPVFVAHGTHDDVLPVAEGRRIRDTLGPRCKDFTYREYPVGHGIGDDELAEVTAWLTAHLDRLSAAPAP